MRARELPVKFQYDLLVFMDAYARVDHECCCQTDGMITRIQIFDIYWDFTWDVLDKKCTDERSIILRTIFVSLHPPIVGITLYYWLLISHLKFIALHLFRIVVEYDDRRRFSYHADRKRQTAELDHHDKKKNIFIFIKQDERHSKSSSFNVD